MSDENGIRTSKNVNGVTTYYNTKDGVILSQSDGTNTMYFQYDTSGTPLGFIFNGTQYLYMTNQMGDVIAITEADGDVFCVYNYDEWGKLFGIDYADEENAQQLAVATANPLRYRGYYYDSETGYYYLQSRYYDPSICRFINADVPEIAKVSKDISAGTNIFAYCNNDAVNNTDSTGKFPINLVIGALVGAILGALGKILEYIIDDLLTYRTVRLKNIKWSQVIIAAIWGAASGALGASSGAKMAQKIGSALLTFTGTLVGGSTVLEAVILTIITILLTNENGLGNSLRKFNSKKVNRSFAHIHKLSKSTLKNIAHTLKNAITYYFKSNKTLYTRFIKDLIKSNSRDWLIAFGLGKNIYRIRRFLCR